VGRKRIDGNYIPQTKNNNSIEDLVGNEENGDPVPDPKKTMINTSNDHKKIPQRGNLGRNHWETHG
jgi:hypothetical protein